MINATYFYLRYTIINFFQQIQSYEKGIYEPDITTLNKYTDFFDVSVNFLLGRTTNRRNPALIIAYGLAEDEQALVDRYRLLLPKQRQHLVGLLDSLKDE